MRFRRVVFPCLVLGALVLATGATQHRLVERWKNPEFEHRRFVKVIVVAIAADGTARRNFEDLFVTRLRSRQIECVPSYSLVPNLQGIGEAERHVIIDAIEREGFDGAISVRAVPLIRRSEEAWGVEWQDQINASQTFSALVEESLPLDEAKAKKYGVEVALWGITESTRVWAARTNPYTPKQMRKGAPEFVEFTMHALEIADLIKGTSPR